MASHCQSKEKPAGNGNGVALHSVSVTTASNRKPAGNGGAARGTSGDQNAGLIERATSTKGVKFASYSSAHGYRDSAVGEWNMLYCLQYEEDCEEECVCWQRVQASHSIGRYKKCMGNPFLKVTQLQAPAPPPNPFLSPRQQLQRPEGPSSALS